MGNLGSVRRACTELGAVVSVADHPLALWETDRMILPGVGSFAEGAARLEADGWKEVICRQVVEAGKPLLGICLGMQLLASFGEEGGLSAGLDLIPGRVRRLDHLGCRERIPHVGWNDITVKVANPLLPHIATGADFYFVHSYVFEPNEKSSVVATVHYGIEMAAAIAGRNVFGVQFHPEKSSNAGRRVLSNFLEYRSC